MKKLILIFCFCSSISFAQNKISAGILVGGNTPGTIDYYYKTSVSGDYSKIASGDNEKMKPTILLDLLYNIHKSINVGAEFEVNDVAGKLNYGIELATQFLFVNPKFTPYVHGAFGYNINSSNGGLIYNLGAGTLIPVANKLNLNLRIVYKNMSFSSSEKTAFVPGNEGVTLDYKTTFQTFNASIGLNFDL
ncbi:unnamed protein product [Rotaria sp. Silwood2]|nr:unnamed protein product [Rotaria sp. Silwood2]CAF4479056.1 unnamed protein product [Rotaria sp. Silwood2]